MIYDKLTDNKNSFKLINNKESFKLIDKKFI
jgi:hypothetical protein